MRETLSAISLPSAREIPYRRHTSGPMSLVCPVGRLLTRGGVVRSPVLAITVTEMSDVSPIGELVRHKGGGPRLWYGRRAISFAVLRVTGEVLESGSVCLGGLLEVVSRRNGRGVSPSHRSQNGLV